MDQIHGSHKVHMSDYVSLSGKHTEKNGAKKNDGGWQSFVFTD